MKRQWTQDELAEHWTLLPNELKLLANRTGATRLGFSLLLKAFADQGRFPRQMHELPGAVIVQSPDRSASLRNCIHATSGRAARSSITASRSAPPLVFASRVLRMPTSSSTG